MAINKVEFDNRVLIDLTLDTVDEKTVISGTIFHKPNGDIATGENTNNADTNGDTVTEEDVKRGITFHKADGSRAIGTYETPTIRDATVRVDSLYDMILTNLGNVVYKEVTFGLEESEKSKVIPENIKKDVTILGVTGTLEEGTDVSDTTASESTVLAGFKFHNKNGNLVTGTIPSGQIRIISSPTTPDLSLNDKYSVVDIERGFYGLGKSFGLSDEDRANLISANIKKDVTILGTVGTLESGKKVVVQSFSRLDSVKTVDLGFRPSFVMLGVGISRTNYLGWGYNDGTGTYGSRMGNSSTGTATSPANITINDNGFTISIATSNYNARDGYYVAVE